LSGVQSDVDGAVRSRFEVKDSYLLPDGGHEFRVQYRSDSKAGFVDLCRQLAPMGLTAWLTGNTEDSVITVRRPEPSVARKSRIPILVLLLSALSILVFSLLEQEGDQQLAPGFSGYDAFFGFAVAVAVVVGARYFGHRYAARRSGQQENDSYLVPGIPEFTPTFPTLGFITYQRAPALNRDRYFEMMIVGPLFVLAAAVVLEIAGDFTAVASSAQLTSCQTVNSFVSVCPVNPSVIQLGIDYLLGPVVPALSSPNTLISPLGDAATVGFLLFFVAVLPMASFDGGHLANTLWSSGRARVATYLSVALLLALDTNELAYWGVAIVVLLVGGRPLRLSFKDEISKVSRTKLLIYLAVLLIAFLAIPIPQDIATVPL
jgi:hypothetical protein